MQNSNVTNDKVKTLLGFALKAAKVVFGADLIERSGKIKIIICCKTLSENTLKRMIAVKERKNIPLIITAEPLEDILHRAGCKAAAVTDAQMATSIINNLSEKYTLA